MTAGMIEGNVVPISIAQNCNYALAEGFRGMAGQSNVWTLMLRYQARAERMYRRAVEEFERLQALRPEWPNEPIGQDQPEEKRHWPPPKSSPVDDSAYLVPPRGPASPTPPAHRSELMASRPTLPLILLP